MSGARVALITGGSSGIGRATAARFAAGGWRVYEMSRRDIPQSRVTHLAADVTDEAAVQSAVGAVLAAEGQIDVLVSCAGFGISGAVEFTRAEDAKRQLDVNFFGTVNVVKAVLTAMRERGRGRILCVSSVAGAIAIPFQTYYSVSKAAINAYACALANEVRPYGVSVAAVMPGDFSTGFTDVREKSPDGDDAYGGRIARSVAGMEKDERNGMQPEVAAAFLFRLAEKGRVKPLYAIGGLYKFFTFLGKVLPIRLVSWIVYQMYAR